MCYGVPQELHLPASASPMLGFQAGATISDRQLPFFFFFCRAEYPTQGLAHTKQVLYWAIPLLSLSLSLSLSLMGISATEKCHHVGYESWLLYSVLSKELEVPLTVKVMVCNVCWDTVEEGFSVEWRVCFSKWSKDHLRKYFTGRLAH
jgi:hypothetical protein